MNKWLRSSGRWYGFLHEAHFGDWGDGFRGTDKACFGRNDLDAARTAAIDINMP